MRSAFPSGNRSDTLRATTSPHVSQALRGIPVGPLIFSVPGFNASHP